MFSYQIYTVLMFFFSPNETLDGFTAEIHDLLSGSLCHFFVLVLGAVQYVATGECVFLQFDKIITLSVSSIDLYSISFQY